MIQFHHVHEAQATHRQIHVTDSFILPFQGPIQTVQSSQGIGCQRLLSLLKAKYIEHAQHLVPLTESWSRNV